MNQAIVRPYAREELQSLYSFLKGSADKNVPLDYKIKVDGREYVRRTSNLEVFYDYEHGLTANALELEVFIFSGKSSRCSRYLFRLPAYQAREAKHKLEVEKQLAETTEREKLTLMVDSLKAENAALREELNKSKVLLKKREGELKDKSKQDMLQSLLASFSDKLISKPDKQPAINSSADSSIDGLPISEADKQDLKFAAQLRGTFSETELSEVLEIISYLGEKKEKIPFVKSTIFIPVIQN